MRFLCLVHFEPSQVQGLNPRDRAVLDRDSGGYDRDLEARGHMVAAEALRPAREAMIVRVRDGRTAVTDGPFMETKEMLGGFILVEAKDMDEAIQIASGIPLAKYGAIEVRPVMTFDPDPVIP